MVVRKPRAVRVRPSAPDVLAVGGEDVVSGDEGDDRISVVDGSIDRVSCGGGADTVFADVIDVLAADCENVRR